MRANAGRPPLAVAGLALLALAWLGPLPAASRQSFAAHMLMHMSVVALACPLLAAGVAGSRLDPLRAPRRWLAALASPFLASAVEFVVVWGWHAPALHHLARRSDAWLLLEQGSFFCVGMLLWLSALGGGTGQRGRAAGGVAGLLLTSMHMTLLGVLLALAGRPLYVHGMQAVGTHAASHLALQDQQLGGVVMLALGGASYLAGALLLLAGLLHRRRREAFDG